MEKNGYAFLHVGDAGYAGRIIDIAVVCATRGLCTIDIVGVFVRVSCPSECMDGCFCGVGSGRV